MVYSSCKAEDYMKKGRIKKQQKIIDKK